MDRQQPLDAGHNWPCGAHIWDASHWAHSQAHLTLYGKHPFPTRHCYAYTCALIRLQHSYRLECEAPSCLLSLASPAVSRKLYARVILTGSAVTKNSAKLPLLLERVFCFFC